MRSGAGGRERLGQRVERAAEQLVGRHAELALLTRCIEPDEPPVSFVHGLGGIGKTALLHALLPLLASRGARVVLLDGRAVEPTPRGLLQALAAALGAAVTSAGELGDLLAQSSQACVLAIDNAEALRLVEPWLRRELVLALPVGARVLLFGRNPPQAAWHTTPGWSGLFRAVRLGPLDGESAQELLLRRGVPVERVAKLSALAHGHPLTLELAASSYRHAPSLEGQETGVLEALAKSCLEDVADPRLRACIEAACIVRRVTRPLLTAMLGEPVSDALLEAMLSLPFVERADDGLSMLESVRLSFEARLAALDPERHRALRQKAWQFLRRELEGRPHGVSWRATADVLFLLRHPTLREAFFPSSASTVTVEPALPSDGAAILTIVARHEPASARPLFERWWHELPSAFQVARDGQGKVLGFLIMVRHDGVPPSLFGVDPLLAAWRDDVSARIPEAGALFVRRAISLEHREQLSDVHAALWIDAKRAYIENLGLGSVYTATRRADDHLTALERLGFRKTGQNLEQDGSLDETLRLDFGPRGILTWVAALIDAHERDDAPWQLDQAHRALMIGSERVALTKLEYGALEYLARSQGRVVTRDELLTEVWGQQYGGSNVVDAVVRLLRKKLGVHAGALQTVKGFGYRLVQGAEASRPLPAVD